MHEHSRALLFPVETLQGPSSSYEIWLKFVPMTRAHKIEAWIAATVVPLVAIAAFVIIRWQKQKPVILHGAVIVQDVDPRKQLPIGGVLVSANNFPASNSKTDSSGFFSLTLAKPVRRGQPIVLHFRHPQYRPLDRDDYVGNQLYIIHLAPLENKPAPADQPRVRLANVRVRYTEKTETELNIGSAVRTFEVENKGNIPCLKQHPCSPDGKWKAALGTTSIDAGKGNEFRAPRASCIAGPCPFTRIESNHLSQGGQILTLTVRDWSDTATFLLEAEVFRTMLTQREHWSYPAKFGDGMSFTLPPSAESVSIEAEVDGQTVIFPVGPSLQLSWASCDSGTNPDEGRIYRCTLKSGYRFQ